MVSEITVVLGGRSPGCNGSVISSSGAVTAWLQALPDVAEDGGSIWRSGEVDGNGGATVSIAVWDYLAKLSGRTNWDGSPLAGITDALLFSGYPLVV